MRLKLRTRAAVERTPPPRPITIDEYYDMDRTGLLEPDARVELIEGEVVHMPPIGSRHGSTVEILDYLLHRAVGDRARVRCQLPVRLSNISEPVPDIAVVKSRVDRYSRLYARHGIPDVWNVDLKKRQLHTYHSPSEGLYRDTASTAKPGNAALPGMADVIVDLSELLVDPL